ncbi:MAG: hypothetical protein ABIF82_03750 [Planctomycetota bacterium]
MGKERGIKRQGPARPQHRDNESTRSTARSQAREKNGAHPPGRRHLEPKDHPTLEPARRVPEGNPTAPQGPPDTALLYSVSDIALLAQVGKAFVVRLCLAGQMPDWIEIDGRRYWDRRAAIHAVTHCRKAAREQAGTRRIA